MILPRISWPSVSVFCLITSLCFVIHGADVECIPQLLLFLDKISTLKKQIVQVDHFATKYGTKSFQSILTSLKDWIGLPKVNPIGRCLFCTFEYVTVSHASCTATAWLLTLYQLCSFISNKESAEISVWCLIVQWSAHSSLSFINSTTPTSLLIMWKVKTLEYL